MPGTAVTQVDQGTKPIFTVCLQSGWGYAAASASNYGGAGYTGGMGALDLGNDSGSDYSDETSEGSESEEEES